MKTIRVVAAILVNNHSILATKRNYGEFNGLWEFPGGKVEPKESKEQALIREIKEELDIDIKINRYFTTVEYDYPKFHLIMDCYLCHTIDTSAIKLSVHDNMKWLDNNNIDSVQWLPADLPITQQLIKEKII